MPKGVVIYTVQGGETERGKLRVWKERVWVHGTVVRKIIIIIIIIYFFFEEIRTTSTRNFVIHTEHSDEYFPQAANCTMQYVCSTDGSKMRYTTKIS